MRQEQGREDVLTRAQRRTRPQPGSHCVSSNRGILALKFLLPCSHPAGTSSAFPSSVQEKGPVQCRICTHTHMCTEGTVPSHGQAVTSAHTHCRLCAWDLATLSLPSWHTSHTRVCLCTSSTWPSTPVLHIQIHSQTLSKHIHVHVYIMMVSYLATSAPKTVKTPKAKQGPCQGNQIDVTTYTQ